jgi:hypothetical protein
MLKAPAILSDQEIALWEALATRLLTLNDRIWERSINGESVDNWLGNFSGLTGRSKEVEQLHGLYLLSQFMYFGIREILVLLRSMYRDLFLLPLAADVKSRTATQEEFERQLTEELNATKFLGVGNPSESGVHLLYYFRQENLLAKESFIDSARLYRTETTPGGRRRVPRDPNIKRYIFLDDLCGSGQTAVDYSQDFLPDLLSAAPNVEVQYLSLFGTCDGINRVREETVFGTKSAAVYELDESYKWTGATSRYLFELPAGIDKNALVEVARVYGSQLLPYYPLGYQDSELLIGFAHNTPDNTLPIIWMEQLHGCTSEWYPIFKRYPKV